VVRQIVTGGSWTRRPKRSLRCSLVNVPWQINSIKTFSSYLLEVMYTAMLTLHLIAQPTSNNHDPSAPEKLIESQFSAVAAWGVQFMCSRLIDPLWSLWFSWVTLVCWVCPTYKVDSPQRIPSTTVLPFPTDTVTPTHTVIPTVSSVPIVMYQCLHHPQWLS